MLKLAGCIGILIASSGLAFCYIKNLRDALGQAEALYELISVLEGEMSYQRRPLPELLGQLSQKTGMPYSELLADAGRRMGENRQADIPELWRDICMEKRGMLLLGREEYEVLLRTGEAFAYGSLDSSMQLMRISRERLSCLLGRRRQEYAGKCRLYGCLCYTAGLFLIVVLL